MPRGCRGKGENALQWRPAAGAGEPGELSTAERPASATSQEHALEVGPSRTPCAAMRKEISGVVIHREYPQAGREARADPGTCPQVVHMRMRLTVTSEPS